MRSSLFSVCGKFSCFFVDVYFFQLLYFYLFKKKFFYCIFWLFFSTHKKFDLVFNFWYIFFLFSILKWCWFFLHTLTTNNNTRILSKITVKLCQINLVVKIKISKEDYKVYNKLSINFTIFTIVKLYNILVF